MTLDLQYASRFYAPLSWDAIGPKVAAAAELLHAQTGPGNDFLGWLDLPVNYDREEFERILVAAERIRMQSEVLVVVGIGGSYLGAKAALEFCDPTSGNRILFAGTNMSAPHLSQLIKTIGDRDFSVNVISKSGTTIEPALAFRVFRSLLETKYGKAGARERIYATTDATKGALKQLSDQEGYETFVVPDNVGGRFSVLTAVGLLPIAVAGIDIRQLMQGAADAMNEYNNTNLATNSCLQYAAVRYILHQQYHKDIELMVNYEPRLQYIAEWWKQLYGESEGKQGKGIFPASVNFTADLHSMGQYIQDGKRHLFETVLMIDTPETDMVIEATEDNADGLNYLAGKTLDYVNKQAAKGTIMAHVDGGVPNIIIHLPEATPYHLGRLFYFFEKACAVSGYMLEVNPFDQPGVEAYKKNMFALLK